ncbi:MAG: DUF1476 domain-containing protein [Alphaproteobacteria bacterium]|nr:DUF1476 domain-containing protein [Alphaproteobacteria bacterium]
MTTFDDRKDAFENKYAHDKETDFKIIARRNKLLGLWAAEQMHLESEKHDDYAKEVVAADFEAPGDEDVLNKVLKDLEKAGISITANEVREEMNRLLIIAGEQLRSS